jgi:itaconate CoA-transferase
LSSHFVWANRSKESITLDVKHPRAPPILRALMRRADVLVQNLAPGAAARVGLDFATLHVVYPRLIVCDISGYGSEGPYRDRKAYDLLIQAEAGFLSVTGTPKEPTKAGCPIADIAAGMYAYSGILAALLQRLRTGEGCRVAVSMLDSMVEWMGFPLYYAFDGAPAPPRAGAAHATIYPYGPFPTGDGHTLVLGLQNEREWVGFCERVLMRPALAHDPRFATNSRRNDTRRALRAIIVEVFSSLTAEQVIERLNAAQIANAHVNDMHDLWRHPQLVAGHRWTEVDSPVGRLPALVPPGLPDGVHARMDAIPALGQHTSAILTELGYDEQSLACFRAQRVI